MAGGSSVCVCVWRGGGGGVVRQVKVNAGLAHSVKYEFSFRLYGQRMCRC